MRLKNLEIKGFKSFADKTLLNFDEGVTGIIGPNGCGKSNIIDAIRWVIGEQKISMLRSESLDNLIFNGSKKRGPSGLAEVSLTFENTKNLLPTEYNTVTVTRKYYRNGDSEYRFNDINCRLKDIRNLFMDTGISTDSYAIIELGMVDDIIKDKDNSRRRMLEQAAGITIYKNRKHEAKLKLDSTDHDLARIEDLLFEVNNQVKSFEKQAKKARKYLEIKKEYKENSIELAKASLEGINSAYTDLNEKQQAAAIRRSELETSIAGIDASIEKDKTDFIAREEALQQLQLAFNQLNDRLRKAQERKNLDVQKAGHLQEKKENLTNFLNRADDQMKSISGDIQFTGEQANTEENKLKELQALLGTIGVELELKRKSYDEKRTVLESKRQLQLQLQKERFEAEKKVAVADSAIAGIERSILQLKEEQAKRKDNIARLEEERDNQKEELENKSRELEELTRENENLKQQIIQMRQLVEELRNRLFGENRTLDARQNEYDLLKNLVDKMEGYPESVKYLHSRAAWLKGSPLVSDIFYVKKEYRAAVENVLEPYLNYYVVTGTENALKSVALLESDKKGKAKFFILDAMPAAADEQAASAGLTPALSVVEYDERYRDLAHHLLGNVVIAETREAFDNAEGNVLEKDGRRFKGKFTLSGGSSGAFEGKKIGRVKNLEKLGKEIEIQKEKTITLGEEIKEKSGIIAQLTGSLKDSQIQETQRKVIELTNSVNAAENRIETQKQQDDETTRRLGDLDQRLNETREDVADSRSVLRELMDQTADQDATIKQVEDEFRSSEEQFNTSNRNFNDNNVQMARQQSRITSLKRELELRNQRLKELRDQIENNSKQLKETVAQLTATNEEIESVSAEITELMRSRGEDERRLNEAETQFHIFRNELNEKETKQRQLQKEKETFDNDVSQTKERLYELKLQLEGMKERLNVEFRISLDEILEQDRNTGLSREELEDRNDKLKKRLENLGEVNPTAVDAFQEMKNRYDFISSQKNDLVEARQSLMKTIDEVETTANQRFLETFNKVRENFRNVFQALFTEDDTADMVLGDPENLAETSIDITAKPKGKRPTTINQLSGGEKTLTATALLFAIYLIKPAPFCILDEVDAPLDDINVQKFTQMIRKFSHDSQFIIITHNKMTMATVDVIYGVTMQEPGVSKLVPVDFRGLENEYDVPEKTLVEG